MIRSLLSSSLLSVLCCWGLAGAPLRAQPAEAEPSTAPEAVAEPIPQPLRGSETYTSSISEVDACNRAQMLRPADSIVTGMHVWRSGEEGQRSISCRIDSSNAEDAVPTRRPILFGPSA
ncbi:hypothetical protein IQ216_08145 [Cyanobium sp. LEGE 06143]|uniref:hypothetical protein n=1 Tax=Cyanobium sp. LEGE 06143 TaxID=945727 RepID=UPI0018827D5D|nr:hypothetical protein [Cyanobium sp. LEGE 06143]MBE9173054.1 hypothetical protein [Cyanobium sp. LEGE 06143]